MNSWPLCGGICLTCSLIDSPTLLLEMDSTTIGKKCFRKTVDTDQNTSCIPSEIPNINTINFVTVFRLRSKPPVLELCSCCFSLPAQIWTQVSPIWKQEEASLCLPLVLTSVGPRTWPQLQTRLRTCLLAGNPPFILEGGAELQLTLHSFS